MKNILLFSDYFIPIWKSIHFISIVIFRFFKILIRFRKKIIVINIEYSRKFLFENSYIIINYRFRNALWYKFSFIGHTLNKHNVIFNLKNINSPVIKLKVYGFFQTKSFVFNIVPENSLNVSSFKTNINVTIPQLFNTDKTFTFKTPKLSTNKISISKKFNSTISTNQLLKRKLIEIKHTNFSKNEFL